MYFPQAQRTIYFHLKKRENNNPENNQRHNKLPEDIGSCRDKYFHTPGYRGDVDIKFEPKTSGKVFFYNK